MIVSFVVPIAIASFFGAVMAPLSYLAAAKLNALQLLEPAWIGLSAIAVVWSIATPCALFLSAILVSQRSVATPR